MIDHSSPLITDSIRLPSESSTPNYWYLTLTLVHTLISQFSKGASLLISLSFVICDLYDSTSQVQMLRFDPSRPGPDGKEKLSLAWSESGHPGGLG